MNINTTFLNDAKLPIVIIPTASDQTSFDSLIDLIKENKTWLHDKLLKHGAILIRGFDVKSAEDFSTVVKTMGLGKFMGYAGGVSPRTELTEGVFTSTEVARQYELRPHSEMSYVESFPAHIYFYSQIAADEGGETPLSDNRTIYSDLEPILRKKLEEEGVLNVRYFYGNEIRFKLFNKLSKLFVSVKETYRTDDMADIEKILKESQEEYEWDEKTHGLRLYTRLPAIREHPITGEKMWFNHSYLLNEYDNFYMQSNNKLQHTLWKLFYQKSLPMGVKFGDGTSFDQKVFEEVQRAVEKNTYHFPWQAGDVMIIDNMLCMHGRGPYKGKRLTMASMTVR